MPIKEIVRKTSISRNTVRKYINIENVTELSFYDTSTPFYTYRDLIITLLIQKKSYKEILVELENKGIKYSYSSLAKYANALKKSGIIEKFVDGKSYTFTRFNLMKIFWNHDKNTKSTFRLLTYILDDYPLLDYIFLAAATFKEVFESKSPLKLDEWIEFYHTSEIKEIRSFINGVKKDYTSVKNSVVYLESNGILEGNVNRLKMIKRSMFGRASFQLLRKKVLLNI